MFTGIFISVYQDVLFRLLSLELGIVNRFLISVYQVDLLETVILRIRDCILVFYQCLSGCFIGDWYPLNQGLYTGIFISVYQVVSVWLVSLESRIVYRYFYQCLSGCILMTGIIRMRDCITLFLSVFIRLF